MKNSDKWTGNGISMVNKLMVIYLAVIGGVCLVSLRYTFKCLTKSDSLIASDDAAAYSATDNDI